MDCQYNISVDLWAVGCITYFLLFGIPPFYSEKDDDDEVMDQLMDAKDNPNAVKFPEDAPCSKEAREFILALLNPDSTRRPTATDALQLEWMRKSSEEDEEEADANNELWEEFRKLRVAELPEDPDERRKRINKILSFVSRGKNEDDDDRGKSSNSASGTGTPSPGPAGSPLRTASPSAKSPAGARKDAATNNSRRDSVKKQFSSLN